MKRALAIGLLSSVAFSGWNAFTMFLPVSYVAWNVGRSVLFVALMVAMIMVARDAAQSEASFVRMILLVSAAVVATSLITLVTNAALTGLLPHRIVQLPEYARDYSYHGYSSPENYLTDHYGELLGLQIFSWTIGGVFVVAVASIGGWLLHRVKRLRVIGNHSNGLPFIPIRRKPRPEGRGE